MPKSAIVVIIGLLLILAILGALGLPPLGFFFMTGSLFPQEIVEVLHDPAAVNFHRCGEIDKQYQDRIAAADKYIGDDINLRGSFHEEAGWNVSEYLFYISWDDRVSGESEKRPSPSSH